MNEIYDSIAEKYKESQENIQRKYSLEETMFRYLGDLKGKSVLDLACGDGYFTRLIKEKGAEKVVGVDISQNMLTLAKEKERKKSQGIEYKCFDAAKLPKIGEFDLATAAFLLHYAETKEDLFKMCKNIFANLKRGGKFITLNNNPDNPLQLDEKYNFTITANQPLKEGSVMEVTLYVNGKPNCSFTNRYWSKETYEDALKSAGFKEVEWKEAEISEEGIKKFGSEFWDDYRKHPGIILIECSKE